MADQRLIGFIQDALKKGNSRSQIEQVLIRKGWNVDQIGEAFTEFSPSVRPASQKISEKKPLSKSPLFFVLLALIVLLIATAVAYWYVSSGACESDSDCDDGYSCDSGECIEEEEVECSSDDDCGRGEICESDVCVEEEDVTCSSDDDCETGEICESDVCVEEDEAECSTDDDCSGYACSSDGSCY